MALTLGFCCVPDTPTVPVFNIKSPGAAFPLESEACIVALAPAVLEVPATTFWKKMDWESMVELSDGPICI